MDSADPSGRRHCQGAQRTWSSKTDCSIVVVYHFGSDILNWSSLVRRLTIACMISIYCKYVINFWNLISNIKMPGCVCLVFEN